MKRRAFVLSEQLLTMMLQVGFILTLFTAFYLMMDFYAKTQAVLSARNHAEAVIQFMDDKIRAAGLGLWQCKDSAEIRARLSAVPKLKTDDGKGYKLPVAVFQTDKPDDVPDIHTPGAGDVMHGNTLVLLYAQRIENEEMSNKNDELITAFKKNNDFASVGTEGSAIVQC